jgi:phage internal scaffolding protein
MVKTRQPGDPVAASQKAEKIFSAGYTNKDAARYGIDCSKDGRTKSDMAKDCDINQIMKKFKATGELPRMVEANPAYGDFSDIPPYQEALERVRFAEQQFAGLPAAVRKRFGNDPAEFLAAASDPRSGPLLLELGLAEQRVKPATRPQPQAPSESPAASPAEGKK